jgi:hypothetical protein
MILLVRISGASTFAAPVAVRAATPTNVALTNPGFESPYLVVSGSRLAAGDLSGPHQSKRSGQRSRHPVHRRAVDGAKWKSGLRPIGKRLAQNRGGSISTLVTEPRVDCIPISRREPDSA